MTMGGLKWVLALGLAMMAPRVVLGQFVQPGAAMTMGQFTNGTYVTPMAGVQRTYSISNTMTYAQQQAVIDGIPRNVQGDVIVAFGPGVYANPGSLSFQNFYGGRLFVVGSGYSAGVDVTTVLTNQATVVDLRSAPSYSRGMEMARNSANVYVSGFKFLLNVGSQHTGIVTLENDWVHVNSCSFVGTNRNVGGVGVSSSRMPFMSSTYCAFDGIIIAETTGEGGMFYTGYCASTNQGAYYGLYCGGGFFFRYTTNAVGFVVDMFKPGNAFTGGGAIMKMDGTLF